MRFSSMLPRRLLAASLVLAALISCRSTSRRSPDFDQGNFRQRLATLALGLNTGNARMAADCFTENAMWSSPPDPAIRKGKQALFEFFGGEKGRGLPMSLLWHPVVFDPETGIGMGEYTFTFRIRTHGVAVMHVVGGKIAGWREYELE